MSKLIILSMENCSPCIQLKMVLSKAGIDYEKVDVHSSDPEYVNSLKKISKKRGVPQVFIEEEGEIKFFMHGFNPKKIKYILEKFKDE